MGKQASFRFLYFEKFLNSSLTIFLKFIFFKFNYRQQLLSQSLNLQMFNRDAKQAEVLLSQQEHLLSKDETPQNLEQAESLIKVSKNIILSTFKICFFLLTYLLNYLCYSRAATTIQELPLLRITVLQFTSHPVGNCTSPLVENTEQ